ncbi:unnamed protein product, partial [Darwinula stevensoni]
NQYHLNNVNKIVITRPHVPVGRDIGFLKGDLHEKTMPWALPVLDVLERHLTKGVVETALRNGNIEIAPLALMRGRSFEDTFVIVDETQNITLQEVKMLVTRIGEGSKLVLNGDIQQSDLTETDGLTKLVHYAKKYLLPIPIVEFGIDDVIRSDICRSWIKVFTEEEGEFERVESLKIDTFDAVSKPSHYNHGDGIECIDYIRQVLGKEGFIAYCRGNQIKYQHRAMYK